MENNSNDSKHNFYSDDSRENIKDQGNATNNDDNNNIARNENNNPTSKKQQKGNIIWSNLPFSKKVAKKSLTYSLNLENTSSAKFPAEEIS